MNAYPMIEQCWERQQDGFLPSPPVGPPEDLTWYTCDPSRERLPGPRCESVPTDWRAPDIPRTPTLTRDNLGYE